MLTVALGRSEWDREELITALKGALSRGCGREDFSQDELSQLIQGWVKVLRNGQGPREHFDATMRSPRMYGSDLTAEAADHLHFVYSTAYRSAPTYLENRERDKIRRKRKAKKGKPMAASSANNAGETTENDEASGLEPRHDAYVTGVDSATHDDAVVCEPSAHGAATAVDFATQVEAFGWEPRRQVWTAVVLDGICWVERRMLTPC